MKASELRVGNYVLIEDELTSKYKFAPANVVSIKSINKKYDSNNYFISVQIDKCTQETWSVQFVKGVPITEVWLAKFGFKLDDRLFYRWYLSDITFGTFTFDLDDNCMKINDSWLSIKIIYVHEMQNLYFALTGQELTLKDE